MDMLEDMFGLIRSEGKKSLENRLKILQNRQKSKLVIISIFS